MDMDARRVLVSHASFAQEVIHCLFASHSVVKTEKPEDCAVIGGGEEENHKCQISGRLPSRLYVLRRFYMKG